MELLPVSSNVPVPSHGAVEDLAEVLSHYCIGNLPNVDQLSKARVAA